GWGCSPPCSCSNGPGGGGCRDTLPLPPALRGERAGVRGSSVFLPSLLRGGAGGGVSEEPNPPTPFPKRDGGANPSPSPPHNAGAGGTHCGRSHPSLHSHPPDWPAALSF